MSLFLVLLNSDSGPHPVFILLIPFWWTMGPTAPVITLEGRFEFSSFPSSLIILFLLFWCWDLNTFYFEDMMNRRCVRLPRISRLSDSRSSCPSAQVVLQTRNPVGLVKVASLGVHPMHPLCLWAAEDLSDWCCLELCHLEFNPVP